MPTATLEKDSTALRWKLSELYDEYAAALDDIDLEKWATFFTDDCNYRVVSAENYDEKLPLSTVWCSGIGMIRDRIAATRVTAVFESRRLRHMVGVIRINAVQGDVVNAQANFAVYESLSDREPHLLMVGRYIDQIEMAHERPLLRERLCVYDDYRVRTSLVYPV